MPQTSMPPLGDIEALLESYKNNGITDVILITLSNGLSGTNQAIQASGKWHGVKIHTLDIYTTLGVEKYLVLSAQKLVEQEIHPEEIISRLKDRVDHSRGFLIPEVDVFDKVRTMSKAIKKAVKVISKDANAQDYEFYVLNGENQEGTQIAIDELHDVFGEDIQIHTDPMYAVIAVHTGLGAVGVQFVKKVKGA